MKTVTINAYECEKCNEKYNTELKAVMCERSHVEPIKITDAFYYAFQDHPYLVEIEFKDGRKFRYKR